jgi:hypothetical protein
LPPQKVTASINRDPTYNEISAVIPGGIGYSSIILTHRGSDRFPNKTTTYTRVDKFDDFNPDRIYDMCLMRGKGYIWWNPTKKLLVHTSYAPHQQLQPIAIPMVLPLPTNIRRMGQKGGPQPAGLRRYQDFQKQLPKGTSKAERAHLWKLHNSRENVD